MPKHLEPVAPRSLSAALAHVQAGGRLVIPTYARCTVIDAKTVAKFAKANEWLLKEDGEGYRVRSGRGSVYVLSGQLRYSD